MKVEKFIKVDDILRILPKDDKTGPKPSYIRKYIESLETLTLTIIDKEDIDKGEYESVRIIYE